MTVEEILLDTNVLLRFLFEPERLPADVVERIAYGRNRVWFSILSLWEIAIKRALRRDEFDFAPEYASSPRMGRSQPILPWWRWFSCWTPSLGKTPSP